jgi:hypothetical protein
MRFSFFVARFTAFRCIVQNNGISGVIVFDDLHIRKARLSCLDAMTAESGNETDMSDDRCTLGIHRNWRHGIAGW